MVQRRRMQQTVTAGSRSDAMTRADAECGGTGAMGPIWSAVGRTSTHKRAIVNANSHCSSPHRDVRCASAESSHWQTAEFEVTAFDAHRKRKRKEEKVPRERVSEESALRWLMT